MFDSGGDANGPDNLLIRSMEIVSANRNMSMSQLVFFSSQLSPSQIMRKLNGLCEKEFEKTRFTI